MEFGILTTFIQIVNSDTPFIFYEYFISINIEKVFCFNFTNHKARFIKSKIVSSSWRILLVAFEVRHVTTEY